MRVNIANFEQGINNGILTKMANRLNEELLKMGVDSKVTNGQDPTADVNHCINYLPYKYENSPNTKNTLQVTHIFEGYKLDALKKGLETADVGICFSPQVQKQLTDWGLPGEKLNYVLPAHDGNHRRHQIVAILTNVYPDNCKREEMFTALAKTIDHNKWAFRIMGTGWHDILVPLVADGLQVDYFSEFDYKLHQQILDSSDYALYFGKDEGSMGLLDAANAGVKTIGTKQGFHIDMPLDHYFDTEEELIELFKTLSPNKVEDWTWENHAKAHIEIWQKLLQ
jgi:hypothetical protein